MIPTELATQRQRNHAIGPQEIARLCNGRVLRKGSGPAGRIVTDSRLLERGDCFVALPGDSFDGHDFLEDVFRRGAAGAVICHSVRRSELPRGPFLVQVPDSHGALMYMAREHRKAHGARVVGITGSCGKTSTKDMLVHVLSAHMPTVGSPLSYNNRIGVPHTLFQIQPDTKAAVVEIGSNSPGEVASLAGVARPDVAIVTGVEHSHLQGLGSLRGVAREKSAIVRALSPGGLAILNGDDPSSHEMAKAATAHGARVCGVRVDKESDIFATDLIFTGFGTSFRLQGDVPVTLPRLGSHNVYNALFTFAAARELGLSDEEILNRLCDLPATSRRLECKSCGDFVVVDDTYNSNPGSARAALLALAGMQPAGRRVVVLGEMLELGDAGESLHHELGQEAARSKVDLLVTVGDGARPIGRGASESGMKNVHHVEGHIEAVELLREELSSGDWVLCKASRRIGLERVVDGLLAQAASR